MKELLIVSFVLVILLVIGVFTIQFVHIGLILFSGFFFPVFLIEAITLTWLLKDFSVARAIFTAFVFYIISIFVSILVFVFFAQSVKLIIEPVIGVGVISLLLHLFLLKLQLKTNLSISVVSMFTFAHIIFLICWYGYKYLFPPQMPTITFC